MEIIIWIFAIIGMLTVGILLIVALINSKKKIITGDKPNRYKGFWNSETPLTSKRARLILSDPAQAEILINAVRKRRSDAKFNSKSGKIKFSKDIITKLKISNLEKK